MSVGASWAVGSGSFAGSNLPTWMEAEASLARCGNFANLHWWYTVQVNWKTLDKHWEISLNSLTNRSSLRELEKKLLSEEVFCKSVLKILKHGRTHVQ